MATELPALTALSPASGVAAGSTLVCRAFPRERRPRGRAARLRGFPPPSGRVLEEGARRASPTCGLRASSAGFLPAAAPPLRQQPLPHASAQAGSARRGAGDSAGDSGRATRRTDLPGGPDPGCSYKTPRPKEPPPSHQHAATPPGPRPGVLRQHRERPHHRREFGSRSPAPTQSARRGTPPPGLSLARHRVTPSKWAPGNDISTRGGASLLLKGDAPRFTRWSSKAPSRREVGVVTVGAPPQRSCFSRNLIFTFPITSLLVVPYHWESAWSVTLPFFVASCIPLTSLSGGVCILI